ncbi:MAG: hypothetical protein ONB48_12180 [candidate division KSB1 bacterium]|nr:hypothetical protein [candidate division KSB1 bacterium]MDZ7274030.1 hypothetical protein [candidate division KSB1 bacterium]MDZ7286403.1 hypothetical protein [candidate division KSB1 bacterium]MDZ7296631.1 hypothetical protein [candidate division KSB1 bacterium]MDZ7306853.1 hypothetical protein [candidate division KSB1 bacterium]
MRKIERAKSIVKWGEEKIFAPPSCGAAKTGSEWDSFTQQCECAQVGHCQKIKKAISERRQYYADSRTAQGGIQRMRRAVFTSINAEVGSFVPRAKKILKKNYAVTAGKNLDNKEGSPYIFHNDITVSNET